MFAEEAVIKASRQYVCVRIESYESEEYQKLIRSHLNGSFMNTAFCLLAPDGKTRLIHSGRSVSRAFGRNWSVADGLNRVARKFNVKKKETPFLTPDFHSFRQALNVSAADQRVLVLISASKENLAKVKERMRTIAWHPSVVGRYHFDLEQDKKSFQDKLSGLKSSQEEIILIKPGEFGVKGKVLAQVSLSAKDETILKTFQSANQEYARTTSKTIYNNHVAKGKNKGLFFEMAMPYGEDRDADGHVDSNFKRRFDRARRYAERTGNLIPLNKEE